MFFRTPDPNVDRIVYVAFTEYTYPIGVPPPWNPGTTKAELNKATTSEGYLNYVNNTMTLSLYTLATNNMYPTDPIRVTTIHNGVFALTPINATHSYFDAFLDGDITLHLPEFVGGITFLIDKFALLAPYIGLASTITVATVATVIYVKRVKRRKEKQ
jgi:hypothetical protein